jgi:hypothetical protein
VPTEPPLALRIPRDCTPNTTCLHSEYHVRPALHEPYFSISKSASQSDGTISCNCVVWVHGVFSLARVLTSLMPFLRPDAPPQRVAKGTCFFWRTGCDQLVSTRGTCALPVIHRHRPFECFGIVQWRRRSSRPDQHGSIRPPRGQRLATGMDGDQRVQ